MKTKPKQDTRKTNHFANLAILVTALSFVLLLTLFYNNEINKKNLAGQSTIGVNPQIREINDVSELAQLNEGWYQIRNGYVFYLESFDSYVPLYIKIKNQEQQNGVAVVYADGAVKFEDSYVIKRQNPETITGEVIVSPVDSAVTGKAVGMEKISGFATFPMQNGKINGEDVVYIYSGTENHAITRTGKVYKKTTAGWDETNLNERQLIDQGFKKTNFQLTGGSTTSPSSPAATPSGEKIHKPLTQIYDSNGNLINTVEVRQVGDEVILTFDGSSEKLPAKLLEPDKINWNKYDGSDKFPIQNSNGIRKIIGNDEVIDFYYDSSGKLVKEETTIINNKDITKITVLNPNSPQEQKTETVSYADGTTRITSYKEQQPDKITYKVKDGRTLEISGKKYFEIGTAYGADTDKLLIVAAKEGFTTADFKDNSLVDGNRKIVYSKEDILVFDGDTVLKQYLPDGSEKRFSGDVTINSDGKFELGNGASFQEYRDNKLVKTFTKSDDGSAEVASVYNEDGSIDITFVKDGKSTLYTVYSQVNEPGSPINGMYSIITDANQYYYSVGLAGGKVYTFENGELKEADIPDEVADAWRKSINDQKRSKGDATLGQEQSRRFLATVERIFTEYRGLGYYASYFFSDDELRKWRDEVDKTFATAYLGSEYWSSEICSRYLDGQQEGIAYAETPQGISQVAAHIEAARTQPIKTDNGTRYIYKITFKVRNGDHEKDLGAPEQMNINVILKGEKTVAVFRKDKTINRGSVFSRSGLNAIVQESKTVYKQVCLRFDNIPLKWTLENNELCNTIQESSGEPTTILEEPRTAVPTGDEEEGLEDF